MKAISIRQPWAWAILHVGKDIENRTWRTPYRGPVLIHAAKGMTREEYLDAAQMIDMVGLDKTPSLEDLLRGGIVGEARIVDCVATHDSPWFFGPYGFVLADVKPLPFRPVRGALGFFDPDAPVELRKPKARPQLSLFGDAQ